MNTKATLGLTAGALAIGLVAGLALGGSNGSESVETTGPGPKKVVSSVPVGYARTKAGAVSAAVAYSRALSQTLGKGAVERQAALGVMSTPERQNVLMGGEGGAALSELDKTLASNKASIRLGIVGQNLSFFTSEAAKVRLWTVSVVTQPDVEGQASWGAGEVELRWLNGDWKLWNTSTDETAAVIPALVGSPSSGEQFEKSASAFTGIDDVEQ